MDLMEYQAKELFAKHGVPVLPGIIADTPDEARSAADQVGGPVVVKAQVKTGGRGKAGGVKLAETTDEAATKAAAILGLDIRGHTVRRVLVTQASDIAEEYYVSFLLDRANRTFLCIASVAGGMEIEQLAVERPQALAKIPVGALDGVDAATAAEITDAAGFPGSVRDQVITILQKLWQVFDAEDATLVEVNPMVRTPNNDVMALDGKVTLDENASFRHPDHAAFERRRYRSAGAACQGEGPQLRQTRWRGRHHRQWRWPRHVNARCGRLRRGRVRGCHPCELPRHRRRRIG